MYVRKITDFDGCRVLDVVKGLITCADHVCAQTNRKSLVGGCDSGAAFRGINNIGEGQETQAPLPPTEAVAIV